MKKPLINPQAPSCAYCSHGRLAPDGVSVLCPQRGVTTGAESCKRFEYDPLKRVPRPRPQLPVFTAEDFAT
ncbi:MAG: hypothetical protein LBQ80_00320 [Clostridium sp.]|jgi:hypothetical protein|nr:hypothetical protein [Clostridium sp.]